MVNTNRKGNLIDYLTNKEINFIELTDGTVVFEVGYITYGMNFDGDILNFHIKQNGVELFSMNYNLKGTYTCYCPDRIFILNSEGLLIASISIDDLS